MVEVVVIATVLVMVLIIAVVAVMLSLLSLPCRLQDYLRLVNLHDSGDELRQANKTILRTVDTTKSS